jgi:hypothetical protein
MLAEQAGGVGSLASATVSASTIAALDVEEAGNGQ